jgi:predicted Zn-dependent protease
LTIPYNEVKRYLGGAFAKAQTMLRMLFLFFGCAVLIGCNDVDRFIGRDKSKPVTYSYSCLDSAIGGNNINKRFDKVGDLIRDIGVSEKSITDDVQTEYGALFHEQMIGDGTFKLIANASLQQQLSKALSELLAKRETPSKITYAVYALEDTAVNAFTFGGRIYVTRAMLAKCKGKDDLLYAILGHEIGHSEMGHIKATIQEMVLSNKIFGEQGGATFFQIKRFLTASANQKNELEADYYGINLTNELGYDVCTAVAFWKEMASNENGYNKVEDFFRTHPFSNLRADCLTAHIRTNFGKACSGLDKDSTLPQVKQW